PHTLSLHDALPICAALALAPWAVRCTRLAHHLVLVQGLSAANFYVATLSDWNQLDQEHLWPRFSGEDPYGRRLAAARNAAEVAEADRFGFRQGVENIRTHPQRYLRSRIHSFPPFVLTGFDFFTGINQSFGQAAARRHVLGLAVKLLFLLFFSLLPFLLAIVGL